MNYNKKTDLDLEDLWDDDIDTNGLYNDQAEQQARQDMAAEDTEVLPDTKAVQVESQVEARIQRFTNAPDANSKWDKYKV